jgi:YidC/Oxa1 family membrane protein insertase
MFEGFFSAVADLLGWFYGLTHSYGGAIVLLTIVVMVVTAPLTLKSTKSMVQLQRLSPELKALQAKYKDDREKLNQEMMAFYKANNINPMGGCLPVVVQMPVFLVLYRVLRGLIERQGGVGSGLGHIVGQRGVTGDRPPLTPWRLVDQPFKPQHLNHGSELYRSLSGSTKMNFLGMDLSITPFNSLKLGAAVAIPYLLLMALMFASQFIQNRQIQGRNTSAAATPAAMKFLPFMLPVVSFTLPTGLGVYYFVQGLARIGLQHYITKTVYSHPIHSAADAAGADTASAGDAATQKSAGGSTKTVTKTSAKTPARAPVKKAASPAPATPKSARSAAAQRKAAQGTGGAAVPRRRSGAPRAHPENGSDGEGRNPRRSPKK